MKKLLALYIAIAISVTIPTNMALAQMDSSPSFGESTDLGAQSGSEWIGTCSRPDGKKGEAYLSLSSVSGKGKVRGSIRTSNCFESLPETIVFTGNRYSATAFSFTAGEGVAFALTISDPDTILGYGTAHGMAVFNLTKIRQA